MPRLTRKEKQAHTRACLMHSAAKLFTKRGLEQASIEDVAEDAGFTKGAFYANFRSKEELFLAMLDERFGERIDEIERVIAGEGTTTEKARRAGDDFAQMLAADPEWERLFFEFTAYAGRNEEFRQELITRYHTMRDRVASALRARAGESSRADAIPYDRIAMMTCAMANGYALERMLEGDDIPQDLYGSMLSIFFAGLRALREADEAVPAGAS